MRNILLRRKIKLLLYPIVIIRRNLILQYKKYLSVHNPKKLASLLYRWELGKELNWEKPKDLNEKINWLMYNTDTSQWSLLADKYSVRQYVKEKIGDKYLTKLWGVWDNIDEIDFSKLPDSFILKSNNAAGRVIIVNDKNIIDENKIKMILKGWLNNEFGLINGVIHYKSILPRIIAEELLFENNSISNGLIDYKIWCFDGQPFATWVCFNRNGMSADTEWHDEHWIFHPEYSVFTEHYKNGHGIVPKPENYDEMLDIARKLSVGFPQVCVDLYNIDGKILFGELTFTRACGRINFYSNDILERMGNMVKI